MAATLMLSRLKGKYSNCSNSELRGGPRKSQISLMGPSCTNKAGRKQQNCFCGAYYHLRVHSQSQNSSELLNLVFAIHQQSLRLEKPLSLKPYQVSDNKHPNSHLQSTLRFICSPASLGGMECEAFPSALALAAPNH